MEKEFVLEDLANLVSGDIVGDSRMVVTGFGSLETAGPGDLSFLAKAANNEQSQQSSAGALIVPLEITESDKTIIRVKNPYLASAIIQNHMLEEPFCPQGIHPSAIVGTNCTIAQQVTIGGNRGCVGVPKIGNNVYVGPGAKRLG